MKAHLAPLLAEDRIGTATHLQEALATQLQVQVHPATLTRHLKRMGYVYKRIRSVPAGVPEVSAVEAFCSDGAHRIRFAVVSGACRTEVVVRYLERLAQEGARRGVPKVY